MRTSALLEHAILFAIAASWGMALIAELSGGRNWVHHHEVVGDFGVRRFTLFFGAWTAMIVAMMLPATLPLMRLFFRAAAPQERPGLVKTGFVGGYVVVWLLFGVVALGVDVGIHRSVDAWPALAGRPWILPGAALLGAGFFQFSALKEKCLTECRHPAAYLMRHYRRGIRSAFETGIGHGLFCLGCCWALMLLMFAMGIANLIWMAALTGVMVLEKRIPGGQRTVKAVGLGMIVLGVLVLIQPGWLPADFQYTAVDAHTH